MTTLTTLPDGTTGSVLGPVGAPPADLLEHLWGPDLAGGDGPPVPPDYVDADRLVGIWQVDRLAASLADGDPAWGRWAQGAGRPDWLAWCRENAGRLLVAEAGR